MTMKNLPQRISEAADFMSPDNLQSMELAFSPQDTIILVVDVQHRYFVNAGSKHMQDVAKDIAGFIPDAKKAGIKVCMVYSNAKSMRKEDIDFFEVSTDQADEIVYKNRTSALEMKPFRKWLKDHGVKNIIVCGGYLSGCVESTVLDALHHKFNVCVARELVADAAYAPNSDPTNLMRVKGATIAPVDKIRTAFDNMPKGLT